MKAGDRVRIAKVTQTHLAHHRIYIGKIGTVTRVYKTMPEAVVLLDDNTTRRCYVWNLEVIDGPVAQESDS